MKRAIPAVLFAAYSALLIRVMVYKDLPTIRIGHLMFNFGGTDGGHPANFIPFTTIVPYLFGNQGVVIAGINLAGNVALLVPLGLLVPLVFRNGSWKKALTIAVAAGLSIELLQAVLRLGIFDIDDVMLNALGVMTGYWAFLVFAKWIRTRNYRYITLAIATLIVTTAAALYALYPKGQLVANSANNNAQNGDLCGGTGGTGQIIDKGNGTITIKRQDEVKQTLYLTAKTIIKAPSGLITESDLKVGDHVTLVVNDTKTASTVLVCGIQK